MILARLCSDASRDDRDYLRNGPVGLSTLIHCQSREVFEGLSDWTRTQFSSNIINVLIEVIYQVQFRHIIVHIIGLHRSDQCNSA